MKHYLNIYLLQYTGSRNMLQRLSFNTLKQRKVNVVDKQGKGGGGCLSEGSRVRGEGRVGHSPTDTGLLSPNRQPCLVLFNCVQFC
jgi:hypothetical protein